MLIAEDFLLLAVDDETGKTANVDNLGVRLAGALLADLAAANKTLMRGAPEAGATKEEREKAGDTTILVTDNAPTGHVALDAALQAVLDTPEAPARKIVEAISDAAEDNLLAALAERGILEKEETKLFRMLPITRWPAADSSHEVALRANLTKVLLEGAEPDERTATLISLLHGSGLISGLVGKVAMPTLAAVLVYAGAKAVSPRELVAVARAGRIPALAMVATFTAVLALPVAQAVGVGVIVSLILQLNQEALDLKVVRLEHDAAGRLTESRPPHAVSAGEVVLLDAYGSLFYAGARTLQRRLPVPVVEQGDGDDPGPVVLLRLRGRNTLGATFLKVIGDYARALDDAHGALYLTGVDPELAAAWERDGTVKGLAGVHIRPATPRLGESTRAALASATARDQRPDHGAVHQVHLADGDGSADP